MPMSEVTLSGLSGGLNTVEANDFGDIKCALFDRPGTLRKQKGWTRAVTTGWTLDTYRAWGIANGYKSDTGLFYLLLKQVGDYTTTLYSYDDGSTAASLQTGLPLVQQNMLSAQLAGYVYLGLKPAQSRGTVTIADGATGVECSGEYFNITHGVRAGYYLWPEGHHRWYRIATITDANTLVLATAFEGPAAFTAGNYFIAPAGLKYDGTTLSRIGLRTPTACDGVSSTASGSLTPTDVYRYRVAFVDRTTGQIGEYGTQVEVTVGSSHNTITLGGVIAIPIGSGALVDGNVTDRMICYDRSPLGAGFSTVWKELLTSGDLYSVEGNSATTFTHSTTAQNGTKEIEKYHDAPEIPFSGFCLHHGMVLAWGDLAHPSRMYVSRTNAHEAFPGARAEGDLTTDEKWWFPVGADEADPIMNIIHYRGVGIIFKKYSIWLLGGDLLSVYTDAEGNAAVDTNFQLRRICPKQDVGLIAADAIAILDNGVLFLSDDGIYILRSIGCPEEATKKLAALPGRMSMQYAYKATAGTNPLTDEVLFSLPIDSAADNNVTISLQRPLGSWESSLIPRGWAAFKEVIVAKGRSLRAASIGNSIVCDLGWSIARAQEQTLLTGTVDSATATTLVDSTAFTSYTTAFELAAHTVSVLAATTFEVREINDVPDANTIQVTTAWTNTPAGGETYWVGGIPFLVRFPPLTGTEGDEGRYKRFSRVVLDFGDEIVSGSGAAYLFYRVDDASIVKAFSADGTSGWTGRLDLGTITTNRKQVELPACRGRVLELCLVIPAGVDASVLGLRYFYEPGVGP